LPRPSPRAADSVQPLVGEEPGLRRPRDRPQCSHRPALHKRPPAPPWTSLATYCRRRWLSRHQSSVWPAQAQRPCASHRESPGDRARGQLFVNPA
jgi:hypothetical protein